jgi:predicted permease
MGLALEALFVGLALFLLVSGTIDVVQGEIEFGSIQIVIAAFVTWTVGRSLKRRFRPSEPTFRDAIVAAVMFAFIGILGLSSVLSGDPVRIAMGLLAAAILLSAATLILLAVCDRNLPTVRVV